MMFRSLILCSVLWSTQTFAQWADGAPVSTGSVADALIAHADDGELHRDLHALATNGQVLFSYHVRARFWTLAGEPILSVQVAFSRFSAPIGVSLESITLTLLSPLNLSRIPIDAGILMAESTEDNLNWSFSIPTPLEWEHIGPRDEDGNKEILRDLLRECEETGHMRSEANNWPWRCGPNRDLVWRDGPFAPSIAKTTLNMREYYARSVLEQRNERRAAAEALLQQQRARASRRTQNADFWNTPSDTRSVSDEQEVDAIRGQARRLESAAANLRESNRVASNRRAERLRDMRAQGQDTCRLVGGRYSNDDPNRECIMPQCTTNSHCPGRQVCFHDTWSCNTPIDYGPIIILQRQRR